MSHIFVKQNIPEQWFRLESTVGGSRTHNLMLYQEQSHILTYSVLILMYPHLFVIPGENICTTTATPTTIIQNTKHTLTFIIRYYRSCCANEDSTLKFVNAKIRYVFSHWFPINFHIIVTKIWLKCIFHWHVIQNIVIL